MRPLRIPAVMLSAVLTLFFTLPQAHATFPGENGKIVFVGNQSGSWQLHTMDPDGSNQVQVTNLPATTWELWLPVFSPDGRRILFSRDTPENSCPLDQFPLPNCLNLYVVNADGTGLAQLTSDNSSWGGTWSPDGSQIVFNHISAFTHLGIVTAMSANGSNMQPGLTTKFWDSDFARYTPGGQDFVFYSQNGGFVSAVWSMETDGTHQHRLTRAALEGSPTDLSPDGRHILLINHQNTNLQTSIFVMNLDGSDLKQLTYPPGNAIDGGGGYSPDGKKVVFLSNRLSPGSLDIFTMNADGTGIERIVSGVTVGGCPDGNCVGPSWGPKAKN
jgi:Tol biopolymer transport system component